MEGRGASLARARLAQRLFGIENIELIPGNLEEVRLAELGRFDVIFCSGLLYRLPEPWRLVEQFAVVAPGVFL